MRLVVTAEARGFRRAVGVTAWAVLEELVLDAEQTASGALVARTNVRRVAAQVGVSKDTVARALARLARAGVVRRVLSPRGERGALPTSSYAVDLSAVDGIAVESDNRAGTRADIEPGAVLVDTATRTRRRVTRPAARVDDAQSSLFDLPASAS